MLKIFREYAKIVRNPWKSRAELKTLQEKMMRHIVRFAYRNTRFYKKKFSEAHLSPSDIYHLKDMQKIPITTKDEIRADPTALFAAGYRRESCIEQQTTGSTGKIIPILHDWNAYAHFFAVGFRMFREWGYSLTDSMVLIRHEEPQKILLEKLGLLRRDFISITTPEREQLRIIKRLNPDVISAYPSTFIALMNASTGDELSHLNVKFINSNSELLTDAVRTRIKKTFHCDVYDEYSTYEVVAIAHECPHHHYHIDMDNVIVDFVDGTEPVSCGERGNIVVTSLVNRAMPFIRYDLDDIGIPTDEYCTCGRTFPLIKLVEGREDDFIVTPEGHLISPRKIVPLVEITPGIKEFQIVQEKKDFIVILIAKNNKYSIKEENKMISRLKNIFEDNMVIKIKLMDKIPRKKGKLRIIISRVNR
jgi:phenylacetate-CoA ligase